MKTPFYLDIHSFGGGSTTYSESEVTTSGSGAVVCGSVALADLSVYTIKARVLGRQGGTNRAVYHIEGLFYREGVITQQGSTNAVSIIESNASWTCDFSIAGSEVRIMVDSAEAVAVTWKTIIEYSRVS